MLPLATAPSQTLRRGTVRAYNASTKLASVALDGALGVVTLPALITLAAGEKVVCLFFDDNNPRDGAVIMSLDTAPTTPPGGSNTHVQYNNSGAFAGSANMTFDGSRLSLAATGSGGGLRVGGDADLYRSAANTWYTPDSLEANAGLGSGFVSPDYGLYIYARPSIMYHSSAASDTPGLVITSDYAGSSGNAYGLLGVGRSNHSSGTVSIIQGVQFSAVHQSAGSVANLIGLEGRAQLTSSGAATNARGLYSVLLYQGSGGSTTAYLISGDVVKTSTGAPTTLYGLYLPDITIGASANYAIYTGAGVVRLGDLTHIVQATPGNEVLRIETTATNDDPAERLYQNRVATTNGTATTIHTAAIPTDASLHIEAAVVARRTGGSAGAAGDGAAYVRHALYKNVSGTVTLIGTVATTYTAESQSAWDVTFAISGTNVNIQVTGAANNNVTWHCTVRTRAVST